MTPWKIVETAEGGDMNEELRRQIEARRDEELATIASVAAGAFGSSAAKRQYRAKHKATADALEWVLDLLDAQPAAVSLPTAFVRATTEDGLELWLEHDEGDALVHAGPAPTGSLALFVRGTISLPEGLMCGYMDDFWRYVDMEISYEEFDKRMSP